MNSPQSVQEVPGYYGSVKIEETVFQQIWAEQDFFSDSLVTTCGKKIVVVDRGDWNRSEEGPDFRHAKLQIDGKARTGDIEIHFQPSNWKSHGHHIDPNFELSFLDKDHTLIINIDKPTELFEGIGTKGIALIPEHLHGTIKKNIEYYLKEAGVIDNATTLQA